MLRIAVPSKGSLSEPTISILAEAGYKTRRRGRELVLTDSASDVELFFLRPRDIAVYAGRGSIQADIIDRDLLLGSGISAIGHRVLSFARSTFHSATPLGRITSLADVAGKRVDASYDHLVRRYLTEHGIKAGAVHLDGAVESSVRPGVADLIAGVVETGSTLKAARLEVFEEPILESETVPITHEDCMDDPTLATLNRRLRSVQLARSYVLVDCNVRGGDLDATTGIAPDFDSPTVSPLVSSEWRTVHAMVPTKGMNLVIGRLHETGVRGIIVTELTASRL